ncbi:MAG: exonuclease domain-containing protein [Alphaproteobacteria bacterium]
MARAPSARRSLFVGALTCALVFAIAVVVGLIGWSRSGAPAIMLVVLGACAAVGLAGFWIVIGLLDDHFDGLERLRGRLVMMRAEAAGHARRDAAAEPWRQDAEGGRLADAALALAQVWQEARAAPDSRLTAMVAAIPDGIVSVTETGLVSLANAPARRLLGGARAALGTSIYAALDDRDLGEAWRSARADGLAVARRLRHVDGHTVSARVIDLGPGQGALIMMEPPPPHGGAAADDEGLLCDPSLHEEPPAPLPIGDDTPLDALPAWVLDLETTGLDVRADRIVSIGAIRQHGARLFRGTVIDQLVNPGRAIPAASSAVHGITDRMVEAAPGFAEAYARIGPRLAGCALVGHNIGFDLTVLRSEAARCGIEWAAPPALDTFLLVAALEPKRTDLNLEALARAYAVPLTARHTALGDCLTTGELYLRLLPLLAERGVVTFGAARAFARGARHALAHQRAAGWIEP